MNMPIYYVNNNPQPTGEHEVHLEGCYWLNLAISKTSLGPHSSCASALIAARSFYSNVHGCAFCCPECHSR